MQERNIFGKKDCLSLHSLGWNFFIDERCVGEGAEMIYTCTDKFKRHSFRQRFKGGKVGASNDVSESLAAKTVFENIREEFNFLTDRFL